jgi:hypothetical protein
LKGREKFYAKGILPQRLPQGHFQFHGLGHGLGDHFTEVQESLVRPDLFLLCPGKLTQKRIGNAFRPLSLVERAGVRGGFRFNRYFRG